MTPFQPSRADRYITSDCKPTNHIDNENITKRKQNKKVVYLNGNEY